MQTVQPVVEVIKPSDAGAVRVLLVEGLAERWGTYDASLNPDLECFPHAYSDAVTLVAKVHDRVVGTGTLRQSGLHRADVIRMSVAAEHRRTGIGGTILKQLLAIAHAKGLHEVVLETTTSWTSAVNFYTRHGFRKTHELDGNTHFIYAGNVVQSGQR